MFILNFAKEDFLQNIVTTPSSLECLFGFYNKRMLAASAKDTTEKWTSVPSL